MESSLAHTPPIGTASAETLPRKLGRYELVEKLGGGMSEVYRARIFDAIGPERPLVIKIAAQSVSDDPRASARFLDEARLALSLSHGNISSAFEFGKADGRYFIVMEYIRGASVRQLVEAARASGQVLSLGTALTIAIEVARALHYAHTFVHPELGAMPLVHRDVNPSNVLVARDGQVKLTDFGIAHALGRDPSHGVVWGQASYVAPELLAGEAAGPASDLFALGCVLFYMVTLEPPFSGATEAETLEAIRSGATPSACLRRQELPAEVDTVLAALMAPAASARPRSAEDARVSFERLRALSTPDHRPSEVAAAVHGLLGPETGPLSTAARIVALTEATVPLVAAPPAEPIVMRASLPPEAPVPAMPAASASPSRRRNAAVLLLGLLVAVLTAFWLLGHEQATPRRPRPARPPREGIAASVASEAPAKSATPAPTKVETPPAPTKAAVREVPSAPPSGPGRTKRGNLAQVVAVSNPPLEPPAAPPVSNEPAVVTLNSWPWSIATVDGRTLPGHTPLRGVTLSPGPHTFRFENPELHMRRTLTVSLAPGERRVVSAVLEPDDTSGGAGSVSP